MKGVSLQISKEMNKDETPKIFEILINNGWTIDNVEFF